MPLARAGDIELSYERSGSGPPLLMIMGLSGTYSHWDARFLELLGGDFEVIIYDHRGVGASSPVRAPFTIADLAQDAAQLMDALEIEAAHVLGFSMGGMVAQELALHRPKLLLTLVLASTYSGGIDSHPARQATLARLAEPVISGDRERAIQVAWEVNVSPAFAANAEAHARFMGIGRKRRVAASVVAEQLRAIGAHDTSERLSSLALPTRVIHGTADEMVPVENAEMIAELIPGAELELLQGAGHLFFWEDQERAAALVASHLAGHAPKLAIEPADSA
jgi:pimeloyl-ACP methyl ester carboxylesterase